MSHSKAPFDLTLVLESFRRCIESKQDLYLQHYVDGFTELSRFFKLMGPVFSFVAKDIDSKLQILQEYLNSPSAAEYETIQKMVAFEQESGLIAKAHKPSGTRSLLRLHRALEFILEFMKEVAQSDENAKTSAIASEVYSHTLSRYHPWLVQKMATVAMYTLPTKSKLIELMCDQPHDVVIQLINETVEIGEPIYNKTQSLYSDKDLLGVP